MATRSKLPTEPQPKGASKRGRLDHTGKHGSNSGAAARGNSGGRRGQSNKYQDSTLDGFNIQDQHVRRAPITVMKASIQLQHHDRQHRATIFTAVDMPMESPVAQAIYTEHDNYVECSQRGEIPDTDTPQDYTFPVMIYQLSTLEVDQKSKQALTNYAETFYKEGSDEDIPLLIMEKMHDPQKCRLLVDLRACREQKSILNAFQQLEGYTIRKGTAPRGWMENQLSQMNDKLS